MMNSNDLHHLWETAKQAIDTPKGGYITAAFSGFSFGAISAAEVQNWATAAGCVVAALVSVVSLFRQIILTRADKKRIEREEAALEASQKNSNGDNKPDR